MDRLKRNPEKFEPLLLLDALRDTLKGRLMDESIDGKFMERVLASIGAARQDKKHLEGRRTERMFGAVARGLGKLRVLKSEDDGDCWTNGEDLEIPDYRLVFMDGTTYLVEVKNFYQKDDVYASWTLRRNYHRKLLRYAELNNCELRYAVYWNRWNIWTLTPPSVFKEARRGNLELSMGDAMMYSEMGSLLGDYDIGIPYPLTLRVVADPMKARAVPPGGGAAMFTIGDVEFYAGDQRISDAIGQRLLLAAGMFGRWEDKGCPAEVDADGNLVHIDIVVGPVEVPPERREPYATVGFVSCIYSNYLRRVFSDADGNPTTFDGSVPNGLVSALASDRILGGELPVWVFQYRPKLDAVTPLALPG